MEVFFGKRNVNEGEERTQVLVARKESLTVKGGGVLVKIPMKSCLRERGSEGISGPKKKRWARDA